VPNMRLLVLLTILVFVAVVKALTTFNGNDLSGYGSIISAGGGLLAVIWFTASLRYQSRQLQDQKTQFLAQFKHLQESSRRDSLLTVKNILDAAEERAISHDEGIFSLGDLLTQYLNFAELKPILESNNPETVLNACKAWMKKEGAALTLIKGIKSAAEVYFRNAGITEIDYTKKPEEFVFIYGPRFWQQPFFEAFQGTATILCEIMVRLEPGRNAVVIAFFAAMAKSIGEHILHMDKVREDIEKHKAKGYPLPKIAEDL
jgi:hypothetical protein